MHHTLSSISMEKNTNAELSLNEIQIENWSFGVRFYFMTLCSCYHLLYFDFNIRRCVLFCFFFLACIYSHLHNLNTDSFADCWTWRCEKLSIYLFVETLIFELSS